MNDYFKRSNKSKDRLGSHLEDVVEDPFPDMDYKCHKNDKNALENYSSWLQKRHVTHLKLGKKIHRGSGDLLMNMGDEMNEVKEEKAALEYTRIPQKFDKYRGNPATYVFPPGLYDKFTCRPDKVKYFYQKTKVQKNEIPEIERVGLPDHIKSEKLLLPRTRNVYTMWLNLEFRKKKVEQLSDLLQNILPHKPVFDKLMVVGNKIYPSNEQTHKSVVSLRSLSEDNEKLKVMSVYDLSLKVCLKINGVYLYENSASVATSRKFHVLFEYDVQSRPLHTKYITFENIGRVTLRIYWKEMKKFRLFRDINRKINNESFCFDKNVIVLVPGQILNFPIWFQTRKVCTVVESWEINTIPKFWSDTTRVFFILQAQTHIENFMKRIRDIKANINHTVKKRIIKEILEDALVKTKYNSYETIDYSYYEPELFEALNFDDADVERRPKYLYDKFIVGQLKEFYAEVRQTFHPKTWSMNIQDLKVVTRIKDLIEYAEERTRQYAQYRLMMADQQLVLDLAGDKKVKQSPSQQFKTKTKKTSLDANDPSTDPFSLKETRFATLMKLISKLIAPSITRNTERLKYFNVFSILCAHFTLMSFDLYDIKPFQDQSTSSTRNTCGDCQRLVFEKFDDLQLVNTKRTFYEDNKAQPKPYFLKNVPSDDVNKTYALYFKKQTYDHAKKEKKPGEVKKPGKKKKKRVPTKSTFDQMSSKTSKTDLVDEQLTIPNFDPYLEENSETNLRKFEEISSVLMVVGSDENALRSSSISLGFVASTEVQYFNMYVTVYSYLQKAVDAVVDCLESEKENRVPHENLEQLKSCFNLFIDDETAVPDVPPINPFDDLEDKNYYEKILSAHLNDVTGKYLVCGKTEPLSRERRQGSVWGPVRPASAVQAKTSRRQVEKTESVFTLPKVQPDEITFRERAAQTLEIPIPHEFSAEKVSLRDPEIEEKSSAELEKFSVPEVRDEFYYCDDEESASGDHGSFHDTLALSVAKTSANLEPSAIPQDEGTPPPKVFNLLKQWTQKRCLKYDTDKAN